MPRLRDDPDSLRALVVATADRRRINPAFIEKDFWVVEVLRAAMKPVEVLATDGRRYPVRAIFKGGTSLSRVFGVIDRFSEDVDLLVSFPEIRSSLGQRDKVLKEIRDNVATHLGVSPISRPGDATTGVKRNVRYPYLAGQPSGGQSEGVLLEMGSRGGSFPTMHHDLLSMVADYAIGELRGEQSDWDEFAHVTLEVLAPERTLLEKLALLHDAASRYPEQVARRKILTGGRHLYDVHQLLRSESVIRALTELGPDGVAALSLDIDRQSADANFSFTHRPPGGYATSPLAAPAGAFRDELEQGYATAMNLVYGDRPTLDECLQSIREMSGSI